MLLNSPNRSRARLKGCHYSTQATCLWWVNCSSLWLSIMNQTALFSLARDFSHRRHQLNVCSTTCSCCCCCYYCWCSWLQLRVENKSHKLMKDCAQLWSVSCELCGTGLEFTRSGNSNSKSKFKFKLEATALSIDLILEKKILHKLQQDAADEIRNQFVFQIIPRAFTSFAVSRQSDGQQQSRP